MEVTVIAGALLRNHRESNVQGYTVKWESAKLAGRTKFWEGEFTVEEWSQAGTSEDLVRVSLLVKT